VYLCCGVAADADGNDDGDECDNRRHCSVLLVDEQDIYDAPRFRYRRGDAHMHAVAFCWS
jgi:hypothetical protein